MALLNFSLCCFVLHRYAFVQYCNVNTIQYNAIHKFVRSIGHALRSIYLSFRLEQRDQLNF